MTSRDSFRHSEVSALISLSIDEADREPRSTGTRVEIACQTSDQVVTEAPGKTPRSIELRVATTWDGKPVGAEEVVTLNLRGEIEHLVIGVDAPFHGDPPPPNAPGATDRLWEYEIVELFLVAGEDSESDVRYLEVEIGPFGHHLVLEHNGVRIVERKWTELDFHSWIEAKRWRGEARLKWAQVPPAPNRVNAFAIHGRGEDRRYLAATPIPGRRPDFHQPAAFPAFALPTPHGFESEERDSWVSATAKSESA